MVILPYLRALPAGWRYRAVLLVLLLTAVAGAEGAAASPVVTLVDSTMQVELGPSGIGGHLLLKADGLSADQMQSKLVTTVKDLEFPRRTGTVSFDEAVEIMPAGATSRMWLLGATIKDLPSESTAKRYVTVRFDGASMTFAYLLTNKSATPFSWKIAWPSSTVSISPGDPIQFQINVIQGPATGVTLHANLLEKMRKTQASASGLRLCRGGATSNDCAPFDLQTGPTNVWLVGVEGVGQFDGSLVLAAREKPEGDTFTMSINSSSIEYRLGGMLVIFVGVVLVWVVSVFGRYKANRDQLLIPASVLREKLSLIEIDLGANKTNTKTPNVAAAIQTQRQALAETLLEQSGLPAKFPLPWNAGSVPADQVEKYRQYLQKVSDWVTVLEAIVYDGMDKAWSEWKPNSTAAETQAIAAAIANLDNLAGVGGTAPSIDSVRSQIRTELSTLKAKLASPAPAFLLATLALGPTTSPTPGQLRMEIAKIALLAWSFLAVVTVLLGSYVLVLSNNGFGSLGDYLLCFLWGVGIPVGAQMSPATSTTATAGQILGITTSGR